MKIQYIENERIDKHKWDKCISQSYNGIVYAYSWYLDIVSPGWDALVQGDYFCVLPLTKKYKYGIHYIIQPSYTQQLGVFSVKKFEPKILTDFFYAIPARYKYININLNLFNKLEQGFNCNRTKNATYQLDLIQPYEKLKKNYSTNTKRNIKKAVKEGVSIQAETVSTADYLQFIKDYYLPALPQSKKEDYDIIRMILAKSRHNRSGKIFAAYSKENNLIATALFLTSHNKSIYLFPSSNQQGKQESAMFALIDEYICKNSGKNLILDFEGSNVPGIARFYGGFGAKPYHYLNIILNKLPFYLKLFKK